MASTQSTLQDFFKTKRSARDGLENKNKSDIVRTVRRSSVTDENICAKVPDQCTYTEVNLVPRKATVKLSTRKVKAAVRNKDGVQKNNKNISIAFKKVSPSITTETRSDNDENTQEPSRNLKRGRDAEEEESFTGSIAGDEQDTLTSEELQHNTTPVKAAAEVPAILGVEEQQRRKRLCRELRTDATVALQDVCVTPDSATRSAAAATPAALNTRGSARKKLDMTKQATDEGVSKIEAPLQLRKCNKLSELRAQLRRVKECDSALQKFRASALVAQQEAEAATALVTLSKGGLPEPRTLGSPSKSILTRSPLKAASPRKLFSPHKSLSSPYPPPASPRKPPPHPQLEQFTSLAVEVPVSPCKTPSKSPAKLSSPIIGVPAYQRYQHLIQDTPTVAEAGPSRELSLPYHYRVLREVFRAVDTVVSLMHNRQEIVSFSKLKPAVQQMLRKSFHERNLGQLYRVFPLAYIFRQDKIRPGASAIAAANATGTPNKTGYQLTITANLDYKSASSSNSAGAPPSGTKVNLLSRFDSPSCSSSPSSSQTNSAIKSTLPSVSAATPSQKMDNTYRKMDSLVLVDRRTTFHNGLVKALHKHHTAFLESLVPRVEVPDPASIKRWHPQFPLDEVPEIEPAALPQPPHVQQYSNATDVLAAARGLFSHNPRLVAAVEKVAEKAASALTQPVDSTAVITAEKPASTVQEQTPAIAGDSIQKRLQQNPAVALALRGISLSLLEKIRAREAAAASRAMVRSSSDTRQLEQLSRLPEMARILRHTVLAEKRGAVGWESVLTRLKESHSGMLSYGELEEHLELLLKEVPEWVTKHTLSAGVFIKINKTTDVNNVVRRLEAIVKERT